MRWLLVVSCLFALAVWYPAREGVANSLADAQALEESLQAVEWYTNEMVRKALQAEADGDVTNAQLLGEKAIASDLKAKTLREQTAAAWLAVHADDEHTALWLRGGEKARERAEMLAKRIPALTAQWLSATPSTLEATRQELEIRYLQSLYLTAQQWRVAADFFSRAGEAVKSSEATHQSDALLPPLAAADRLQVFGSDPRLRGAPEQVKVWQQQVHQSVGKAP
jgi:hypothetical protein